MTPHVTWLLPVRNGMPYLTEALASIASQTYRDWEVLAWDNGSTDGSAEELRRWLPTRIPGRAVTDQPLRLGLCRAEMVRQARAELCACMDADDVSFPDRLEKQVAFLQAHTEVAAVGGQMECIDSAGRRTGEFRLPLRHADIVHAMLHTTGLAAPTVLFRRSAVLQVGNYRDLELAEDLDLWLRIAARYAVANLDSPLVRYRIHERSTTQIAHAERRLREAAEETFCRNAPLLLGCSPAEARRLRRRRHPCAVWLLYRMVRRTHRARNGSLLDRMRSESFISAGRQLAGSSDLVSRLALAMLERRRFSTAREIVGIFGSIRRVLGRKEART